MANFFELLRQNWKEKKSLCVGLDSEVAKLPNGEDQLSFNRAIIEATCDLVAAYKPNSAFYESQGAVGWEVLKETIRFIHEKAPGVPVILDAKRADIGNTNAGYAQAAFGDLQADAITLNPYMGIEALAPFLSYKEKGCFILCRTSNPGAKEFQDLVAGEQPLYLKVAEDVAKNWNQNKNCGLVAGATYPEELKKIREVAPELPFLVPGIGSQGGDLQKVLQFGETNKGEGLLLNVSRSVLFASSNKNFAEAARREVENVTKEIVRIHHGSAGKF
ncbi:MAG: orotidine-5'-phosphate decarboxylase [Deltaproteobacteria bacterium]|nr:orotidine-5'-phosphate decarboxylase [Deltaproteobacteria bacterium]